MESDTTTVLGAIKAKDDVQFQPQDLLSMLRSLLDVTAKEGASTYPTSSWVNIIKGVADGNLLDIPIPGSMNWNTLVDKIHYADSALDLVHVIVTQDEDIYRAAKDLLEKVVFRLLNIAFSIELWLDLDVPVEPGLASPVQLKEKTSRTLVAVIHGMANAIYHEDIIQPSYEFLRRLPSRLLELNRSLLSPATVLQYPIVVNWLEGACVEQLKNDDGPVPETSLVLHRASHVPVLLSTALRTATLAFYQPLPQSHLLYDIRISLLAGLRTLFDYCLSPSWATSNISRCGILSRFLALHTHLSRQQALLEVSDTLQYISTRLFQARMDGILDTNCHSLDEALKDVLQSPSKHPSRPLIIQATHILKDGEMHPQQEALASLAASYVKSCIASTDEETFRLINIELSESNSPEANALRNEIQQLPKIGTATQPATTQVPGRLNMKEHVWRKEIKELVAIIISPDPLAWMDDDFRPNEDHFIRRVLNDICDRFQKPLENVDEQSRIALAQQLARLPCLLTLCSGEDCLKFRKPSAFNMVHLYLPVIVALLRGDNEEVTPLVRRAVFQAMCPILRHRNEEDPGQDTMDVLFRGIGDKDRSTRLQAGATLQALLQVYGANATTTGNPTAGIFDRLYNQIDMGSKPVREALVVSVGKMGTTKNHQILGNVVCLLVAQLGRPSDILLRSLAYTQILAVAKHHSRSAYGLIVPYLDQIAPLVVGRLCTQPALLQEICRLMAISQLDFLSINLSRTLPDLLVRCDLQGLDMLAKLLDRERHTLIVGENLHLHLAPIFLLKTPGATSKSINFVLQILNEASTVEIDLRQVLPGCTTPLLTEIIVMMGDYDPSVNELAKAAIRKVENALKTGNPHPSQGSDPGAFLASQMLGIISRIIEMLQDIHGKKSVLVKQKIIRSLGALIVLIGPTIHGVASQIMATFQTMISVPELSQVTVESWYKFLVTMGPAELGPHLGATCAAFVASWPNLSPQSKDQVREALHHTFSNYQADMAAYLGDIVDLSVVDELEPLQAHLNALVPRAGPQDLLKPLLARCGSNNITIATLSLAELLKFSSEHIGYIQSLASGDVFDSTIGRIFSTLYKAACRDGEGTDELRLLAYQCIGMLGAMDPYRFEMGTLQSDVVVTKNFADESETMAFVLHLIQDLLVDAFRSTSDIKYQTNLAYPIQELLKYCGFSSDLVNSGRSAPVKIRNRWNSLSKDVLDVITPLLEGRFSFNQTSNPNISVPVYPTQDSYREWIQLWTTYLISKVSGHHAQRIFRVFLSVVRSKDVVIAKHILPHIVLNILISGDEGGIQSIREEIKAVLEDQVDPKSVTKTDKKLLSAQAIFALLDHLNRWVRFVRREIAKRKSEAKRARSSHLQYEVDEQLTRVNSVLSSIEQDLMARAAFQCKAYARSLMNFEQQILSRRQQGDQDRILQKYYDTVHEIYSHLDEPDGMEGVSTLLLSPSMEHQIREHESTGKWTAAQSCWEVRLQHSPDNLDFHLGLLRCLRNLGHYDTLRNHVKGVLTNHPEWESALADFHVESSWMVGAWDDINSLVNRVDVQTPGVVLAKVLLSMRRDDQDQLSSSLATARRILGAPITAAGVDGYRRTYNSVLNLHMTYELELVYDTAKKMPKSISHRRRVLSGLSDVLTQRLSSTLPTFRCREPILSMRRVGFSILPPSHVELKKEIGSTWLASAKIARKAGHWQTAYSAMLQAQQHDAQLYCLESAKLVKASGEPLRALQELENYMRAFGFIDQSTTTMLDLTIDEESMAKMKSKLHLLRARWMNESDRYEATSVLEAFKTANELDRIESSHFYFGNFYDKCFKELSKDDKRNRGVKMNMYTVRHYAKSIRLGSKYIYHTVPRLLTLWLDNGEDRHIAGIDSFHKINDLVGSAIREIPAFKWFTAFPQIVSRVGHNNDKVYTQLAKLIVMILQEYPRQALWGFASVVRSTKNQRETRGRAILEQLRSSPSSSKRLARHIADSVSMFNELLLLCNHGVHDDQKALSMSRDFKKLKALGRSDLLIPLQESLTVTLPSSSSAEATHQPFPVDAPTFQEFADEIEIMKSMARPRKITIHGSDGLIYMFLGKPKDDLRKDARLMDFNSIINKLLKTNSDARRRQLHIRTYGVVTLNEECGFIQWVPNTIPVRHVLVHHYEARRIRTWGSELVEVFGKIEKATNDADVVELFQTKVLNSFPPVFHEWFIETFPEPSAWLASRLNFGRTAAVMSMVGYILGLGDRHNENILLDLNTGDIIHVDFNCLFEKGKHLQTPERVPFRLTQNIVDGLGIAGVEGVFRIACEITMGLLRENKESLTSVLDAFIHDPLVEWEDEKRKRDRQMRNQAKAQLTDIAKNALEPIARKLEGYYQVTLSKHEPVTKLLGTNNLVESLIQEATSLANLAKMYPGWASWM